LGAVVTIISVIGAILVIGIIVVVHEFGHYSIGRACKIKIVEFAVGFGPKIKSWVKNGIIYSLRWLPLGGFTKFYGEDEASDEKLAFNNQPAGRRALTIAAGPVYNIVFALLLTVVMLCAFGDYLPTVGSVLEGSPAQEAGLQPGDVILEMNGVEFDFAMELESAIAAADYKTMDITVRRDGETKALEIPYRYYEQINGETYNRYMVGITSFGQQRVTFGFFEAIGLSFKWMFLLVKGTLDALFSIVRTGDTSNMGSIVYVTVLLTEAIKSSLENVLRIGVVIGVSLAVFNLLPLPALDGGRLVFIGIEKIFRKPVPRNVEGMIHFIGFALLILIAVFFIYKDIARGFG
jgi:regulator of sigma E protease